MYVMYVMKVTEDQCTRMSANAYKEMNQNTGLENVHCSGMYQMLKPN